MDPAGRPALVRLRLLLLWPVLLLAPIASAEVAFDWVRVADGGNACDTQSQGCFGAVAEPYLISRFEVTNAQYAEFLNAVAASDTNGLYNMGVGFGGITRSGSAGSHQYSAIAGREAMPVNYVSFWDATRFANWLHNGQPTGAQDDSTTEDGAYTLTPTGIANNTIVRNQGAAAFVSSEDEWYKAAYYDTNAQSYFDFPLGSDTQPTCAVPGAVANTANCDFINSDSTAVGGYSAAASAAGTFDQGGNVWEWNEAVVAGASRSLRGGSFFFAPTDLRASHRIIGDPGFEDFYVGFRVAAPAPPAPVPSLGPLGLAVLPTLLIAAAYRRLQGRVIRT